ncbi:hypothetical protein BDV28DRAFT_148944 [Aspergillus coremiiformis]|uniref:Cyanovirin-N domain-containing protein n=1 Tax=Aspergillus coremiiformis TaxID=138285 RepID=A0A5N6Z4D7_9EURO|nr:hypothetical protein BDV28DRAFT_148944 [Aspergillus coremiiformis]
MYQKLILLLVSLSALATANNFLNTCQDVGVLADGRTLTAKCDHADQPPRPRSIKQFKSVLDLSRCLKWDGKELVREPNGNFFASMVSCNLVESATLACNYYNFQNSLLGTRFDLNSLVYNKEGVLGCMDYLGVPIDYIR